MSWQAVVEALPLVLPAAAAGALVAVIGVVIARRARRRPQASDAAALRSDVAELAGQLEDYARQIDSQVAHRLARLQALVTEANGKQDELRRLLDLAIRADGDGAVHPRAANGQVPVLASQGLDSVEIARRLRMDVGEVELILNLHRSHASPRP